MQYLALAILAIRYPMSEGVNERRGQRGRENGGLKDLDTTKRLQSVILMVDEIR